MKYAYLIPLGALLLLICFSACQQESPKSDSPKADEVKPPSQVEYNTDHPESMIKAVMEACGGWDRLYALNDIEYTYIYEDKMKEAKDISLERYIFEGEHSWGKYKEHQVNVLTDTTGEVIQYYDGKTAKTSLNGEVLDNEEINKGAWFLRKVNYHWMLMPFKMADPGINYEYLGSEKIEGETLDKLKITYEPGSTGKDADDTFILYIHPETKLFNRFLFSFPAMGVNEPVLLMKVDYTEVEGILFPTSRTIYMPDSLGNYSAPMLISTAKDIKLNNGFKPASLNF